MTFKKKTVTFDLTDIGSQVIDQLSSDIYVGPGSILREVVKNAYDAYLGLDADQLEDESLERAIVISRHRDENGTGHLYIADQGVGQSFETLRGNVQISISHKPEDLADATGFRGLGSWAILGAGSKVVITSTVKGSPSRSRLGMNVRKIYEKMGINTTLDDILNDADCIVFSTDDCPKDDHGTTVEIECDGPTQLVNGYELNRVFDLTDPANTTLKGILVESCPIPYSSEGNAYPQVHDVYQRARYVPTAVSLDGNQLKRRLPADLIAFHTKEITIDGRLAAIAWYVEDPKQSKRVDFESDAYLVGGPGIQLVKYNVPIGPKNIFNDGARENLLDWFVGEVHIVSKEVQPNASGQDLRIGLVRDLFIEELNTFYGSLDEQANTKSERLNLEKHLKRGVEAAAKLKGNTPDAREEQISKSLILRAVQALDDITESAKAKTDKAERIRDAMNDPGLRKLRDDTRKTLKAAGWFNTFSKPKTGKTAKATTKNETAKKPQTTTKQKQLSPAEFQGRVAKYIPRLESLDLTSTQIKAVLAIIDELFALGQEA